MSMVFSWSKEITYVVGARSLRASSTALLVAACMDAGFATASSAAPETDVNGFTCDEKHHEELASPQSLSTFRTPAPSHKKGMETRLSEATYVALAVAKRHYRLDAVDVVSPASWAGKDQ